MKPIQVNKEILLLSRCVVLCATPVVPGKFSLQQGAKLDSDTASKEQ